ncbi:MAG: DUF1232 domain-containing protein [Propionibacteriales bacterium]|nr:DUF1232 domain-containing protein [Propionibacteriales bacterium]
MNTTDALLLSAALTLALYVAFVTALLVLGRRQDARALAGFIPDCVVLFRRLLGNSRVPRSRKLLIGVLIVYLASPIDLVPDFIPVAGQLDDLILAALVLRIITRSGGPELLEEHWPGRGSSLGVVRRLAYGGRPARVVAAGRYGPFYRTSSAQSDEVTRRQLEVRGAMGTLDRGSDRPSVRELDVRGLTARRADLARAG